MRGQKMKQQLRTEKITNARSSRKQIGLPRMMQQMAQIMIHAQDKPTRRSDETSKLVEVDGCGATSDSRKPATVSAGGIPALAGVVAEARLVATLDDNEDRLESEAGGGTTPPVLVSLKPRAAAGASTLRKARRAALLESVDVGLTLVIRW